MSGRPRFVFDTNVLVSALMFLQSKPRLAWNRARKVGIILASDDTGIGFGTAQAQAGGLRFNIPRVRAS
jgi:hypothetical protein